MRAIATSTHLAGDRTDTPLMAGRGLTLTAAIPIHTSNIFTFFYACY
jgi:hypothetical protein